MTSVPATKHYRMSIIRSMHDMGKNAWDTLLQAADQQTPFLAFEFLDALHASKSASAETGWRMAYLSLWDDQQLVAALPLYEKAHSYGEYVFDWSWANAYHQHGLQYYPKLLSAIPFTPVAGNRLLALNAAARQQLIDELLQLQDQGGFSSSHILFPTLTEAEQLQRAGFLLRQGVQFHWSNQNYLHFDDYLASLDQKKRKNIRAERRKVAEAGVSFKHFSGEEIDHAAWLFFKRCYDNTYAEHHSSPYLNLDFFLRIGKDMPQNLHLILAIKENQTIAASLLIHDEINLYGRYWGAVEHVPCLHFETAYYQAIEFCIAKKIRTFEGGAQGEHKMARGFLPRKTYSVHYLSEPAFADAVARFLERETNGIEAYVNELNDRTPFRTNYQTKLTYGIEKM
ncbi:MAG: GNAT family N-acetyltransferase [Burkholderiaceae bacterium]|nr:GNAT family N-acetyltransferase [Burkholderiaceae bacterium]